MSIGPYTIGLYKQWWMRDFKTEGRAYVHFGLSCKTKIQNKMGCERAPAPPVNRPLIEMPLKVLARIICFRDSTATFTLH